MSPPPPQGPTRPAFRSGCRSYNSPDIRRKTLGAALRVFVMPCCDTDADTFIQKTKKLYMDTRTQRNLAKLTDELSEVHSIMTRNIQEVLGQGQQLDGKHLGPREH